MTTLVGLGPKGSYGHLVRNWVNTTHYDGKAKLLFGKSNDGMLRDVDLGSTDGFGKVVLVPIYNSTAALVPESVKFWMERDDQRKFFTGEGEVGYPYERAEVIGKVSMRIRHQLIVADRSVRFEDITRVMTHQQGWDQCEAYIRERLPRATFERMPSTSAGAEYIAGTKDRTVAAICSQFCAEEYGLNILAENIEDNPNGNYTHFYAVTKKVRIVPSIAGSKIAFLLWPNENTPGVLADLAGPMAQVKIDITFATSILLGGTYNPDTDEIDEDVAFFVEMKTHPKDYVTESVLMQLALMARKLVILGSFDNWGVIREKETGKIQDPSPEPRGYGPYSGTGNPGSMI